MTLFRRCYDVDLTSRVGRIMIILSGHLSLLEVRIGQIILQRLVQLYTKSDIPLIYRTRHTA